MYPYTGPANSWGPYVRFIYQVWLLFILLSAYECRLLLVQLLSLPRTLADEDKWLLNIFGGVVLIYLAYATASYTSYLVGAFSFSFLLYIAILLRFFRRHHRAIAHDSPLRYANSSLQLTEAQELVNRLEEYMRSEQIYLDSELSLLSLSDKLACTSKALSQAINQVAGCNYSSYIAQLRIAHAKELLQDSDHAHYKIAAIAYASGFNSLSSFNTTFKRITGQTPRAFRAGNNAST